MKLHISYDWISLDRYVRTVRLSVVSDRDFMGLVSFHDPDGVHICTSGDIDRMSKFCGPRESSGIRGLILVLDSDDVFGRGLNRLDKPGDPQYDVGVHHMRRMDAANDQLPAVSMLDDDRPRPGT
jgi:hypothetical protein